MPAKYRPEIVLDGRVYLSRPRLCMEYDIDRQEFMHMLSEGMPHIAIPHGRQHDYYINISDFHAWNRGEYPVNGARACQTIQLDNPAIH